MPICPKCGGDGRYPMPTEGDQRRVWCFVCRGRGLVNEPDDCPTCQGSGWCFNGLADYDCPDCRGSGQRTEPSPTDLVASAEERG